MADSEPRRNLILQNLLWPAVAGNVAWSLFQLIVEGHSDEHFLPRLFPLILLVAYLTTDWLRTLDVRKEVSCGYVACDVILVAAIGIFAIATQDPGSPLEWLLAAVFAAAMFGHLSGAWPMRDQIAPRTLAGINGLGIGVLLLSHLVFDQPYPWNLTAALIAVLCPWWWITRKAAARSRGANTTIQDGDKSTMENERHEGAQGWRRYGWGFLTFTGGALSACILFLISSALSPTIGAIGHDMVGLQPHLAVEVPPGTHTDQIPVLLSNSGLGVGVVRSVAICAGDNVRFAIGKRSRLSLDGFKKKRAMDPEFEDYKALLCSRGVQYLQLQPGTTDLSLAPGSAKMFGYAAVPGLAVRSEDFSDWTRLGRSLDRLPADDQDCVIAVSYSDQQLGDVGYRRTVLARCVSTM